MMDEAQSDVERIGQKLDANGDEVPQDHPIENPHQNGDEMDDEIAEPHPHEPGAPDEPGDGDDETSQPAG